MRSLRRGMKPRPVCERGAPFILIQGPHFLGKYQSTLQGEPTSQLSPHAENNTWNVSFVTRRNQTSRLGRLTKSQIVLYHAAN